MKIYLKLILLFLFFISGCARQNHINFSSSDAFFSSLNEEKTKKKETKIKKIKQKIIKKSFSLTLSSYKKQLKQKINSDEYTILKIFNGPSLEIKHGKIKNAQFHLKSCHLDLFFLNENKSYKFKHFDIRPSSISSNLNEKECVKQLNSKFILIPGPK